VVKWVGNFPTYDDNKYRKEIIMNERTYTYVSDKFGNEPFETTLEGFKAMFQGGELGPAPELYEHQLNGHWVVTDDNNEVILSTDPRHTGK
jgi:hypothetical protein